MSNFQNIYCDVDLPNQGEWIPEDEPEPEPEEAGEPDENERID